MGQKFEKWTTRQTQQPGNFSELTAIIQKNRDFLPVDNLQYGDYGLLDAATTISLAIEKGRRIALYADYDVDGTMSCVSWIWFFEAIGFKNFVSYIPCRFEEGYGLNLEAIQHLIDNESAQLIITMDTGITANREAAYCKERGVGFICTDHHKIQADKMPDCIILNPKMHPEKDYQELCGAGITFVLLRKLATQFPLSQAVWNDILGLVGMATICDVVPLNGVNHKLANLGVKALLRSERPIFKRLREACSLDKGLDEKDVGFRIGPRINAVGRLHHAREVVKAFINNEPESLVAFMDACNEERKLIQGRIVKEARGMALEAGDAPIMFLGAEGWHTGVVGIAASKIAEGFWRPTWLFERTQDLCKGSARSIPGFDVTEAMVSAGGLFEKFGGHRAAGGFSFRREKEDQIRLALYDYARQQQRLDPDIWRSKIAFDCDLSSSMLSLELAYQLEHLKPFGHGFEEPLFCLEAELKAVRFLQDRSTGEPKHTSVMISMRGGPQHKIMFLNEVIEELEVVQRARFLVYAGKNFFRGQCSLSLTGKDWDPIG
ncbi:MAG: DHH family phosphoesterase [Proteobacteria bacterium]|nr:DHH family phosphoesterase [Pseudomonadota bacterium]